jgi:hypothetical protein
MTNLDTTHFTAVNDDIAIFDALPLKIRRFLNDSAWPWHCGQITSYLAEHSVNETLAFLRNMEKRLHDRQVAREGLARVKHYRFKLVPKYQRGKIVSGNILENKPSPAAKQATPRVKPRKSSKSPAQSDGQVHLYSGPSLSAKYPRRSPP